MATAVNTFDHAKKSTYCIEAKLPREFHLSNMVTFKKSQTSLATEAFTRGMGKAVLGIGYFAAVGARRASSRPFAIDTATPRVGH
jgi:hypothetical protein